MRTKQKVLKGILNGLSSYTIIFKYIYSQVPKSLFITMCIITVIGIEISQLIELFIDMYNY